MAKKDPHRRLVAVVLEEEQSHAGSRLRVYISGDGWSERRFRKVTQAENMGRILCVLPIPKGTENVERLLAALFNLEEVPFFLWVESLLKEVANATARELANMPPLRQKPLA